jgi:DNA-binding MarR family transcriptional regulator
MSNKDQRKQSILEQLHLLATNSTLYNQTIAAKTGLYSTDMACMEHLILDGPLTAGAIAKRMGLATGTITALIDRLEKGGYVRREHGASDRRQVLVIPNAEKFNAEIGPVTASLGAVLEALMVGYSKGDLRAILDFISKANEVTAQEIAKLRG